MSRFGPAVCALLIAALLWTPRLADGQPDVQAVQKGKKAAALVEVGDGVATAFCIDPDGLFVTNAHVVEADGGTARSVKLVLNAGEADQKVLTARVIRADKESDLALLKVENAAGLTSLDLGRDDELIETTEIVAFGYPFGKAFAAKGEYPSVSVNTGRITSLRKRSGVLELIQLDVMLNPGNSGGPVLDRSGAVLGVVQFGLKGAGINFAIPVKRLSAFLATPMILFEPPALTAADREKPVNLNIKVVSTIKRGPDRTVEVLLGDNGQARKFVASSSAEGLYTARVVPVPPSSPVTARVIDLTAEFGGGQIQGRVADQKFQLGAKDVTLSELTELQLKPMPRAPALDHRQIDGPLTGLASVALDLGGVTVTLDLGKATKLSMRPPPAEENVIACTIQVRDGGRMVAELKTSLDLQGRDSPAVIHGAGGGPPGSVKPAPGLPEKSTRKVPGTIADVVVGGGGRFLCLVLKDIKKLGVFDVNSASIIKYLPLASDEVLAAAGSEKLILVYPDQRLIQRWNLGSLERELTKPLPFDGVIKAIAMGSNSTGPMLVHWGVGSSALDRAPISFLDVETLKVMTGYGGARNQGMAGQIAPTGQVFATHYSSFRDLVHWRASANGRVFGAWCTSHSPSGLFDLVLQGKDVQMAYEHNSVGHVVPGPDGRVVYTGYGGLFSDQLKAVLRNTSGQLFYLPSADPNYYMSVSGMPGPGFQARPPGGAQAKQAAAPPRFNIHIASNSAPLLTLDSLDEMALERDEWAKTDFTTDKRYHFVPAGNLLVTIPSSNDQLVLRRVDLVEALQKAGVDYLFVTSIPTPTAFRRQTYIYQIETKSNHGGRNYSLSSGPDGMTVSPSGKVNWAVPADYEGADPTTVVISISNSSGQETFHTFDLRVR